jgi:twinkle protein
MENTLKFKKYHLPCPACGSSDALSINENGSAKCFSCDTFFPKGVDNQANIVDSETKMTETVRELNAHGGTFAKLADRNISRETAEKYGVKTVYDSAGQIAQHIYPLYINNELTSNKIRYVRDKKFSYDVSPQGVGLFGQQLFKEGGKYLTITEGECDAMAAYELLGSKWAVVSIIRGASGAVKDVKENLEYIESFDNIVICFDKDRQGIESAKKVASILKPGKAKIITLPNGYKDANDREKKESVPYPWAGLNQKLYGLRQGELVTLTGGTGLGKSSITRELEHWLVKQTNDNVGIIALEEDWRRTVDGILSIEANARLYVDQEREKFDESTLMSMFDKVFKDDKVFIHAHFGTNQIDDIFAKLRYLIVGCDCKWVVVDHLHMLVSALGEGDERRAIDNIMTRLRSLVEETGAGLILVSHLRRVDGNRGHENGIEVSLSHLRGSNSIGQLSDCVIALERNQQSDDPEEARTTRLRILKSRYTGDVGMATALIYDKETGRLSENYDTEFTVSENQTSIAF